MTRQVRLSEDAVAALDKIAEMTGRPRTMCLNLLVDFMSQVISDAPVDGRIVVRSGDDGYILPLRRVKK